ncbi:electron transport complex protein RnfC [Heliobacterium gestii]|uniref:Electron transport complex protein RnfC n=1 Tax=Heliomicrobium gestii TaxID=2699 RepID=A0A845L863_HELGE|nr:4Fe-4S dicluster domain-containing protein [Heliomicrobium gestii]MBM7866986.1 Na+-translocating ferredoxin:NAD+ oxidoreductase RnfC subunit [Heliomicrobium gestii]MZP42408.1 electron transport complex protein RnfC [Heliomicrobium gestii]
MIEKIVDAVKAAGVVGAGGAGFPTHVKINAKAELIIANGAECEPLLRAHQQIMAVESDKVVLGMIAVMLATGATKSYIALKKKYAAATEALEKSIAVHAPGRIELFFMPDFYPAGDEQVMVYEVTGRIVPEGGIPLQVGVVVINVETLLNVTRAMDGVPVTEKYVTVSGAVHKPVTLKVPVGISVSRLVEAAGGAKIDDYALIDGGPMMGRLIEKDAVVTKTTGGILVLPQDHPLIVSRQLPWQAALNRSKSVCCACRACTDSCPRHLLGHGLEPHRIMQAVGNGLSGSASTMLTSVFLCSECGACDSFGCTMGLSPRRVNAELKRQMSAAGIKNPHHNKPLRAGSHRNNRRIPIKRLVSRLGLYEYDIPAPLVNELLAADEVRLPLRQHIGAPAVVAVSAGDKVTAGQLVAAMPEGAAVSANIHASIDGVVVSTENGVTIRAEA